LLLPSRSSQRMGPPSVLFGEAPGEPRAAAIIQQPTRAEPWLRALGFDTPEDDG